MRPQSTNSFPCPDRGPCQKGIWCSYLHVIASLVCSWYARHYFLCNLLLQLWLLHGHQDIRSSPQEMCKLDMVKECSDAGRHALMKHNEQVHFTCQLTLLQAQAEQG